MEVSEIISGILAGIFLLILLIAGIIWFFKYSEQMNERDKKSMELNVRKTLALEIIAKNLEIITNATEEIDITSNEI